MGLRKTIFGKSKQKQEAIFEFNANNPLCYSPGNNYFTDLATGIVSTIYGGAYYQDKGLHFDGTDDYSRGLGYYLYDYKNSMTIEIYFKMPTIGNGYREILSYQSNNFGSTGFRIQRNGNLLQFTVGAKADYSTSIRLTADTYYFISFTITPFTETNCLLKLYLNGIYQREFIITMQFSNGLDRFLIANTQNPRYCDLIMRYAKVTYNESFNASEILNNYNTIISQF